MTTAIRLVAIGAAVAIAAGFAASAGAAAPFCKSAAIYSKNTNLLAEPPATIAANFKTFKAAQPGILSHSPTSLKSDFQKIFAFDNTLLTDLSKVGWTVAKLPRPVLQSLAVSGPKLKPASDKVIGYLDSTCGFKIAKP